LTTFEHLHFKSAQDDRNNITVNVKNTDDVLQILTAIKSAGMALPELDVRKPNLEEVFLSLTGEALHEQASVTGAAQ
jgi:ABC-2 type transport system ATP-binding protein